jgi:hypothetical protein
MSGKVGAYIPPSQWTGTGVFAYRNPTYHLTYRHMKKLITPLSDEGTTFASALCPTASFETEVTTDVLNVTCPGFIYPCAAQNYQEESCVVKNPDGSFTNCQRNSATGSCTVDTMVYNYFSTGNVPYILPLYPNALVFSDLSGFWQMDCAPLYGLPDGWAISEMSYWDPNGQVELTNFIYSDSNCENMAFIYDRSFKGYFGEESTPSPVFSPGSRIRELAIQYQSKSIRNPSADGVDYLNGICPQLGWKAGNSVNMLNNDCLPFIAACNEGGHYEYIQAGLTGSGNLIRYTINPVNASCSVATYSTYPFLESLNPPIPYVVLRSDSSKGREISFFFLSAIVFYHFWM